MIRSHDKSWAEFKKTYVCLLIPLLIALLFTIFSNHAFAQSDEPPKSCDMYDEKEKIICEFAKKFNAPTESVAFGMMLAWVEVSTEPCGFKFSPKFSEGKEQILKLHRADVFYNIAKQSVSFADIPDKKEFCERLYMEWGPDINNGALGMLE